MGVITEGIADSSRFYDTDEAFLLGYAIGGGGKNKVPFLSESTWESLSIDKKREYGLVAIQQKNSGFVRGQLVYGHDYAGSLLSASYPDNILAEAISENFIPMSETWGGLTLVGFDLMTIQEDGSIKFEGDYTSAYYNLGSSNTPVTNYMVFKSRSAKMSRLICNVFADSRGNSPGFYLTSEGIITMTYYGSDTSTGVSGTDGYHCIAISNNRNPNESKYYVDGVLKGSKTPSNIGRYTEFSTTLQVGRERYGGDFNIKYMAVVQRAEDETTIIANMRNIMTHYGISLE